MNLKNFKSELEAITDKALIKYDEPMSRHTSFKVGGYADILITPNKKEQVSQIIEQCKKYKINYFIMGNGSNLIVKDGGFRGVIIKLTQLNKIEVNNNTLLAETGVLLSALSKEALKNNLSGMEFISGIPGTVGGAVTMNAGAYGPEIKDILTYAIVIDEGGKIQKLNNAELLFSYRNSIIQSKGYIVLEAAFELQNGSYDEINDMMKDLNKRRHDKQPLEYPSAGSTFRRPASGYASKLIDDAGLRGLTVGGAMVSVKHAGFVINYNSATANDILLLTDKIKEIVKQKFDINLELEVKVIGEA